MNSGVWLEVKKISLARGIHTNIAVSGSLTFVTSSRDTRGITDVGDVASGGKARRAEVSTWLSSEK